MELGMTVLQVMFIVISLITLAGGVYTVLVRKLVPRGVGIDCIAGWRGGDVCADGGELSGRRAGSDLHRAIAILIIFAVMVTRGGDG